MTPSERKRRRDPEKVRAEKARWYQKHKAEIAAKTAARIAANPAKKRAWVAKWKKEHPEAFRVLEANRRARMREAGGKLSPGIVANLMALQRGKCACCKQPLGDSFHLDHIMPLALGGTNTDDNIQLLRAECNMRKQAQDPIAFMQSKGLLL